MVILDNLTNTPVNMCDDAKNDARLNVLYSPFRKRELNPQDWESKMSFWQSNIFNWCINCKNSVFSIAKLQLNFTRNGRPATCLTTVIENMLRNNEIVRLQDLLSKDPSNQTWSSWAVNCFVKAPIVWSFTKLKESLVTKAEINPDEEYVHLAVLKKLSDSLLDDCKSRSTKLISLEEVKIILGLSDDLNVKVIIHWLQLQGKAAVTLVNNKTLVKLATDGGRVTPLSDADVGLHRLQQNEEALKKMLGQLEKEKHDVDLEARSYLKKGMRQVAKSCLRKKKELEKCIDKRASALENVQVLLSRVKEAESDGEILESYRMGLSALKATFKDAGLSEDSVGRTMDQVQEVLEVHEEIQTALSEPMAAGVDQDLEQELAELLSEDEPKPVPTETHIREVMPDLPEPPTHSPRSTPVAVSSITQKAAQRLLQ